LVQLTNKIEILIGLDNATKMIVEKEIKIRKPNEKFQLNEKFEIEHH
jgi:hypothetical protein